MLYPAQHNNCFIFLFAVLMFTELGILCIIMYSKFKTSIDSSCPREGNCNPCWSLQSPGTAQYHSEKGVVLVWPSPIWNICQTILLCVLVQLKHDSKSSSIDKILQLFLKQSGKQSFLVISGVSPLERGRFCQANWFCLCRHAWRTLGAVCSTAESIYLPTAAACDRINSLAMHNTSKQHIGGNHL